MALALLATSGLLAAWLRHIPSLDSARR